MRREYFLKPMNISIATSVSGPITADQLCAALDYLQKVHPILRSQVVEIPNQKNIVMYGWRPLEEGKKWYTFDYLHRTTSQQIIDIIEHSLQEQFPTGEPLARVYLLQNLDREINEIVVSCSHVLFDGRAFLLFWDQLLFVMSSLIKGVDPGIPKQTKLYIPPANRIMPELHSEKFATLPISARVPARERKWGLISHTIPVEDPFMHNLKLASKAHHVSMNAAMCASFIEAMDLECKRVGHKNPPFFKVGNTVATNGKSSLQLSSLNVTAVMTNITKSEEMTFWDVARNYELLLKQKIENQHWESALANVEFSPEAADSELFDEQGRVLSFCLTNVGDLNRLMHKLPGEDIWDYPPFKVENLFCGVELKLIGSCFVLALATYNGNLSLNIGFPVPTYDRNLMHRILGSAITIAQTNSKFANM
eukprot:Phypoly_transcript_08842.p1 GENE.Phypoly_transcript_08842~~Phypoly_transcript_08842.p1  ORF type:complete len:472 (+),score=28.83 Phypoly_transcript_08842:152-1417(+)